MTFAELSLSCAYVLTAVFFAVFTLCIVDGCLTLQMRLKNRHLIAPVASCVWLVYLFCLIVSYQILRIPPLPGDDPKFRELLLTVPASDVITGTAVVAVIILAHLIFTLHRMRHHTNLMSIKEGIDKLETGVCYYRGDGLVKLINPLMDELALEITGSRVLNGTEFFSKIKDGRDLVHEANGRVWQFKSKSLPFGRGSLEEIIASDITEETKLLEKLRESRKQQEILNERLARFATEVDEVTVQREILDAKIHVHNELGQTLLMTKRYLSEGTLDETEETKLREIWNRAMLLDIPEETSDRTVSVKDAVNDAAGALGIEVVFEGDVDELSKKGIDMLMAGARESLTNAYRHAGAGKLYIDIRRADGCCIIEYGNDGVPSQEHFKEGGGLSSLRKLAEQNGCSVLLNPCDGKSLRITVPDAAPAAAVEAVKAVKDPAEGE